VETEIKILCLVGWALAGVFAALWSKCRRNIKVGTPSASHNKSSLTCLCTTCKWDICIIRDCTWGLVIIKCDKYKA
jgi:hypothetical protein